MELRDELIVRPETRLTLAEWDPDETLGLHAGPQTGLHASRIELT